MPPVPQWVLGDDVNIERIEETLKAEIESLKRKLHRRDCRIDWLEERVDLWVREVSCLEGNLENDEIVLREERAKMRRIE